MLWTLAAVILFALGGWPIAIVALAVGLLTSGGKAVANTGALDTPDGQNVSGFGWAVIAIIAVVALAAIVGSTAYTVTQLDPADAPVRRLVEPRTDAAQSRYGVEFRVER